MPARKPSEIVIQKTNGYKTTIVETKIVEKVMTIVENVNWKEGTNPSMSRKEDARFQVNYENKENETYLVWFGKYGNAEFIRVSAKGSTYGTLMKADQAKQLREILFCYSAWVDRLICWRNTVSNFRKTDSGIAV